MWRGLCYEPLQGKLRNRGAKEKLMNLRTTERMAWIGKT